MRLLQGGDSDSMLQISKRRVKHIPQGITGQQDPGALAWARASVCQGIRLFLKERCVLRRPNDVQLSFVVLDLQLQLENS